MNNTVRTVVLPPPMKLRPFQVPDCRDRGEPRQCSDLLAVEGAQFGEFGDQLARDDRPDAGDRRQEIFGLAPGGRAAHGFVDVPVEIGEFLLERPDQPFDRAAHPRQSDAAQALALRAHHLDDLAATGDEIGQDLRRLVGQRANLRCRRLGDVGG